MKATKQSTKAQSSVTETTQPAHNLKEIKLVDNDQREIIVRRFKSDVQQCIKNDGYQKYKLRLRHEDHEHRFDNMDMNGKPYMYSDRVMGHQHRVKMIENANGTVSIECGPPVELTKVQTAQGIRQIEKPITFAQDAYNNIVDEHIHEWEFIDQKKVSGVIIKAAQETLIEQMKKDGFTGAGANTMGAAPAPFVD